MTDVPLPLGDPTRDRPFAHGTPPLEGDLRCAPDDFRVEEVLGFRAHGSGEHLLVTVRKTGANTIDIARALARIAGVAPVAIGFAGLKDRDAVTVQHFTVQLPGRDPPDFAPLSDAGGEVVALERHDRKLRRGALEGNRFRIVMRGVTGDRARAEVTLAHMIERGVPNYFGPQRYGRDGANLAAAADMLAKRGRRPGRERRGMLISAARSFLFDRVLAARVEAGTWDRLLEGDVVALAGSHSHFRYDASDPALPARLASFDVHPSGPLPGAGGRALETEGAARDVEQAALADFTPWIDALAAMRVDADRRALRVSARSFEIAFEGEALVASFFLPAGSYATTFLRELVADRRVARTP